jgi:Spy/CpxP family protein refolding chaperone
MRKLLLVWLSVLLVGAVPLWAADDEPSKTCQPGDSDYEYESGMGLGMMDYRWGHRMRGYGHGMGPGRQGWQRMTPDQREQWRQMRTGFLEETLPLRQELKAKQMELETLWEQQNHDPEKLKALSNRITGLRSELDQKHDELLIQWRQKFGDQGWTCPGGCWQRY